MKLLVSTGFYAALFAVACALTSSAQDSTKRQSSATVVPVGRKTVGISFEGGGALGLAHVGVMMWMDEHHIPIDSISGTSMGALVGGLLAVGQSPQQIAALAKSKTFETIFITQPSLNHSSFRRRQDRQEMPHALTLGLKGGVSVGNNLINDSELNALLNHEMSAYGSNTLNFDDLPIPFRCVASNLTTLSPYTFDQGSLPLAVRASISIPGVFAPIHTSAGIMADGAITDNLPIDVLRQDLRPDIAISVYLGDSAFSDRDAASLTSVLSRALSVGTAWNVALTRPLADIEISPAVTALSVTDYSKADLLVKAGYDATELQRERLLPLALDDADWKSYQANIASRQRSGLQRINVVRVEGPDPRISVRLAQDANKLANRPFNDDDANSLVANLRGEGTIDAYYETFHVPPSSDADPKASSAEPDNGIIVHWKPNIDGPPYLLVNADIAAMNGNVTSGVIDLRFIDENLGGYGSELRADSQVGYLTRFGLEYYRALGNSRVYLQPSLVYLRTPIYYWENQKRVSERLLQRAGGGFDLGMSITRALQVAVRYQNADARWVLKDGTDSSPTQHLSGTSQSIAGHIFITNRSSEIASPTGGQLDLTVGHLLHTADSVAAPLAILKARQSFTFAQSNSVIFSLEANTYFRNNVADPFRFTIGGPLRLSASSVDEFRGTDTGLLQSMYLRRIAVLPTGLGQGIYLAAGYEGGSVWSPERTSILRQDGVFGVLVNTPIGVLTLGGAIGDAGHRKVFFTLGKFF